MFQIAIQTLNHHDLTLLVVYVMSLVTHIRMTSLPDWVVGRVSHWEFNGPRFENQRDRSVDYIFIGI